MLPEWTGPLVAKAKVAGLLGAALAAGGVGGTFALTHVAPAAHQTVQSAAATASADPQTSDADPESTDAQDPQPSDTPDPESTDAQDPESGQSQQPAACPADVKNHGAYVSSVAKSAARGKGAHHGATVSAAAKSDCGKPAKDSTGSDGAGDPESGSATSGDAGGQDGASTQGRAGKKASGDEGNPSVSTHVPSAPKPGKGADKGSSKH